MEGALEYFRSAALRKEAVPNELGDTQYARLWEYAGPEELVRWWVANLPK